MPILEIRGSILPDGNEGDVLTYVVADSKWKAKVGPGVPSAELQVDNAHADTGTTAGNFKIAHGLSGTPTLALIQMTSLGIIALQNATRYDGTYIYLQGSDDGLLGYCEVYA
jgi:hypothetical protein